MTNLNQRCCYALCLLLAVPSIVSADSWGPPTVKSFPSENGLFVVTIVPAVSQSINAGPQEADGQRHPNENQPRAEIYSVDSSGALEPLSTVSLVNKVAPIRAIVSNDGAWLATFDNWGAVGYGDTVVVIYRVDGTVVRSLSLEDILVATDLAALVHSASSRHWSTKHRFDEAAGLLVLGVTSGQPEPIERFVEIDLESGSLVAPRRALFPFFEPSVTVGPADPAARSQLDPGEWVCKDGEEVPTHGESDASFERVASSAANLDLPIYTMNGATAKIRGRVVLDILIDRSGDVRCVSILKGLPMGLDEAARSAAFGWRFSPAPKLQRTLVEVSFGHIAQPPLTPSDSRLTNR